MNIQEKIKNDIKKYTLKITTPNLTGDFLFYSSGLEKQGYNQLIKLQGSLERCEDLELYFSCPRWSGMPPPVFTKGITYMVTLEETYTDTGTTEKINISKKQIATPVDRNTVFIIEKNGKRGKVYDIKVLEKGHDDHELVEERNSARPMGTIDRVIPIADSGQAKKYLEFLPQLDSFERSKLNSYSQRYLGGGSLWEPDKPYSNYISNDSEEPDYYYPDWDYDK